MLGRRLVRGAGGADGLDDTLEHDLPIDPDEEGDLDVGADVVAADQPAPPLRSISIRLTEMSMSSARWQIGTTNMPVNRTSVPPT